LCAIWQSEKEATLFVTHDIEEAIQLAHLVLVTSAGPATIPGRGGVDLSEPATSIRIFRVMGMSLRLKTRIGNPPAMNDRISAYDLAATNTLVP
jgi:ABC-type nitrate/sulfonate/bicarbonate transport system ATPase subunit